MWKGRRSTDKSYSRDNRLISPKSSHRRGGLAPQHRGYVVVRSRERISLICKDLWKKLSHSYEYRDREILSRIRTTTYEEHWKETLTTCREGYPRVWLLVAKQTTNPASGRIFTQVTHPQRLYEKHVSVSVGFDRNPLPSHDDKVYSLWKHKGQHRTLKSASEFSFPVTW